MTNTQNSADAQDTASLSYEDARDQLVDIVRTLEAGNATLEESLALWERGEALAARCAQWLDDARGRLNAAAEAVTGSGTAAGVEAPAKAKSQSKAQAATASASTDSEASE